MNQDFTPSGLANGQAVDEHDGGTTFIVSVLSVIGNREHGQRNNSVDHG